MSLCTTRLLQARVYLYKRAQVSTTRGLANFINRNHKTGKAAGRGKESSGHLRDFYNTVERSREELRAQINQDERFKTIVRTIAGLNQDIADMESKKQRVDAPDGSNQELSIPPPSIVSLEVLSNGTTSVGPCFLIKTSLRAYVFNCPEGTGRFLPAVHAKSTNIYDIFMTRGHWYNIGGVSGLLLSKETTELPVRLHGPKNVRHYLECIRPFLDTDFGASKYPVAVVERPYDAEAHEDTAMTVRYIPLFGDPSTSTATNHPVDIAFLVELKPPLPRIDVLKLIELQVPKGPLVGKLKAGNEVTLPDGRVIKPEQVVVDKPAEEKPSVLVVEVESEEKLKSLVYSELLKDYYAAAGGGGRQMHYVVHFTRPEICELPAYKEWMERFGRVCTHIMLNGSGPALPLGESCYKHQKTMTAIAPRLFPALYPPFQGFVEQDSGGVRLAPNVVAASVYQRFPMRGIPSFEEGTAIDHRENLDLNTRLEERPEIREAIDQFQHENPTLLLQSLDCDDDSQQRDEYPIVIFLGTASASPSSHRNVSSYMVHLARDSYIMVDCGEGTYGQLRVLFGPKECERVLLNLNAIFITHAHQDHMNGIFSLVMRRREAFERNRLTYRPLIITLNAHVRRSFGFYGRHFENLEGLVLMVDVSMFNKPITVSVIPAGDDEVAIFGGQRVVINTEREFPPELYSPQEWNLREARAIHVLHTKLACGYVFIDAKHGRKIVFSGDTRPCDLLVDQGKGADLLVHEATFEDGLERDAIRKRHSTMAEAVEVAKRMGAKHVVLSHFSSRYSRITALPDYLLEAGNICVAKDFMVVRFNDLPHLSKLLPLYKELFHAELFELEVKQVQRQLKSADEAAQFQPGPQGLSSGAP